jgi:hypothetical protein
MLEQYGNVYDGSFSIKLEDGTVIDQQKGDLY